MTGDHGSGAVWKRVRHRLITWTETCSISAVLSSASLTGAAEFARAGMGRSMTLAAQSRTPNSNYHTSADTLDRMDPEAMRLMNLLCVRLVAEIDRIAGGNGSEGEK